MRFSAIVAATFFCCCLSSCSQSKRPPITGKVPLTRVIGRVVIDGIPMQGVQIQYVPQAEIAEKRDRYLNRLFLVSGDGGLFSLSTYVNGDGVPYGEYTLEFKWVEQRLDGEIDRLGGFYSDPSAPFMKIRVEKGKSLDLGEIKLETRIDPMRNSR
jgi:hypothetical protein